MATLPTSRLLLVDDDPALLLALSGMLRNRLGPCTVDACGSGVQALDFIGAHTYDTIISDVTMPGMDGWQFLSGPAIAVRYAGLLNVRQGRP